MKKSIVIACCLSVCALLLPACEEITLLPQKTELPGVHVLSVGVQAHRDLAIYTCNFEGEGLRRIHPGTPGGSFDGYASFTSNGKKIIATALNERTQHAEIYLMDTDGTSATQAGSYVLEMYPQRPVLSPDGSKIYFSVFGTSPNADARYYTEFWAVDVDGSHLSLLQRKVGHLFGYITSVSPDGATLSGYISQHDAVGTGSYSSDIFLMQADGSNFRKLTQTAAWSGENYLSPRFTPNGRHLIYLNTWEDGTSFVCRRNLEDGGYQMAQSPDHFARSLSLSSDGSRVALIGTDPESGVQRILTYDHLSEAFHPLYGLAKDYKGKPIEVSLN